jgi:hypothetical protein
MRPPTQANAPQIGITPTGNAVVVWQEPDIEGDACIWARRLFGHTRGYVLAVSATSFGGQPIKGDADEPTLAVSRLGRAEVAYRQAASPGSALPGPRILVNGLPSEVATSGQQFTGAVLADQGAAGGAAASVGSPSIDVDDREEVRIAYDSGGTVRIVQGSYRGLANGISLGPPLAAPGLGVASVMNPSGGGITAWPSVEVLGRPAVAVREDFPTGAVQTALLSGGNGGGVEEVAVGRSGLGDALVAFQQGAVGNAAIVAAEATAPPANLLITVPVGWVKPAQARVSWQPPSSANGPLSYRVLLDGRAQPTPAGSLELALNPRGLGDGTHRVQVLATDRDGQTLLTPSSRLRVDGEPPTVTVKRARQARTITVAVRDAASGVNVHSVSISFGDGKRANGRVRVRHRYPHAGIYMLVFTARDWVGNRALVRRPVSVR